jgi:hypothetical protein
MEGDLADEKVMAYGIYGRLMRMQRCIKCNQESEGGSPLVGG